MSKLRLPSQNKPVSCLLCHTERSAVVRFHKQPYTIYRCKYCSGCFVFPQPTEDDILAVYGASYFARGEKYLHPSDSRQSPNSINDLRKLRLIRQHKPSGALLDVGCALGEFLELAKRHGYDTTGVEISEYAASYARTHFDLDVRTCDIVDAHFSEQSFDIVTLWDVFEHLMHPHNTLHEISRILRPGGILCISTGDASSLWARICGRHWHLLTPPQHVFFYTPQSLLYMLQQHHMSLLKMLHLGKTATLNFIAFKARETFGPFMSPFRALLLACGLQNIQVHLNLWDILTIIAQKPYESKSVATL